MTADELKTLLYSGRAEEIEHAIEHLVTLLTSLDEDARQIGYDALEESFKEALYRSCLNYGSLAGGFTQPLMTAVTRSVETWVKQHEAGVAPQRGRG